MLDKELIESDIDAYLAKYEQKELLRFVAVGSVDDGKSTLIGRLLYETEGVYEDQLEDARNAASSDDGEIDFALITDGLKAEREQGITIDVAYRYFHTARRKYIIADTPGHVQYTRNMATGASTANVAIILIDARLGVLQQSRRHAYIASLLGIPHLFVCVNKMDLEDYSQAVYDKIVAEFTTFADKLRFTDVTFMPISALKGDNVVQESTRMPWYGGKTLLEHLETVTISRDRNLDDFRYPVQYVIRPDLHYRGFAGQIASGVVEKGDEIVVLPSGKTSRVKSIDTFSGSIDQAFTPQSVCIRLEDEIDISRGDMICHPGNRPHVGRRVDGMLVWMSETPLDPNKSYFIKHTTQLLRTNIERVHWKADPNTLEPLETTALELNEIGRITLHCHRPLFYDAYAKNRSTGAFILIDSVTNNTVGAGMLVDPKDARTGVDTGSAAVIGQPRSHVSKKERQQRLNQKGATLWLTGLPAAGKSTLGYALERSLFDLGHVAVVVDPDDTASSFGEDPEQMFARRERIEEIAEFARRSSDAALITIVTFSAPLQDERDDARKLIGDDRFFEVHVATPEDVCRKWCVRGTYEKLSKGGFTDVEGDSIPYEAPAAPVMVVHPHVDDPDDIARNVVEALQQRGILFQA